MPGISKESFTEYIKELRFTELFNELGWDHEKKEGTVTINEEQYKYNIVASLHGFYVLTLKFGEKLIPQNKIRRTIASKLSSTFPNSLFIFFSEQTQYWSYMIKRENLSDRYTETAFSIGQEADALFQRAAGLFFEIDEMEKINFIDVNARVKKGFQVNYDTITKKFYDYFKKEHTAFKESITGITQDTDLDWYASVTLNRLMFCYFIQKKGFLSEDRDYLSNRLKYFVENKDQTGFFSFYKQFLIVLFHKGLGSQERDIKLQALLGNIPYLNGGMFEVHELESKYTDIDISNDAFQKIFNFFDQYKWHLDISPNAPGNEINPDVLGYIFEKYINQRAEMGAYYTKEDITGYIGKNTILPFLFDEVKRHYTAPFQDGGEIWQFMKCSEDDYIYPAIKHGIADKTKEENDWNNLFSDLPEEVQKGLDTEQKDLWIIRKTWNKPAPSDIALPTEIYREVIDRRYRYKELRTKIDSGEVKEINDLITNNLDIINFTHDLLENTQDPRLVENFYKAVQKVTILDPTCGSGAFLFAAMNILEPLYEILIERMRTMVYDEDISNSENYSTGRSIYTDKFRFFRGVLDNIIGVKDPDNLHPKRKHPNQKYFIFKSIILNNLYGVDIMKEAVEIAKLRMFLKLVAQVHPDKNDENLGIEPLPDMDFNIKYGNTLVGFATKSDIENISSLLLDETLKDEIYDECEKISMAFEHFKEEQLSGGETSMLKLDLKERISKLNENLNILLYKAHYGGGVYENWKSSYQPFHWFAEFYEILDKNSGFDVIIGNPPYVEYSTTRKFYSLKGYETLKCGNLYAFCIERSWRLSSSISKLSMIVQAPIVCTMRMNPIQMKIKAVKSWILTFDDRPLQLFDYMNHSRMVIFINDRGSHANVCSITRYLKIVRRETLFSKDIVFEDEISKPFFEYCFVKTNSIIGKSILLKLQKHPLSIQKISGKERVFFYDAPGNYIRSQTFPSPSLQILYVLPEYKSFLNCLINSSLFFFYCSSNFFGRTGYALKDSEIYNFPIVRRTDNKDFESLSNTLDIIYKNLLADNTQYQPMQKFLEFGKETIDKIDNLLGELYGLNQSEIDFIINFDIKSRDKKDG